MVTMRRGFLILLLLAVCQLWSQSVQWQPASDPLLVGQPAKLGLVFSQCQPDGEVALPAVATLRLAAPAEAFAATATGGTLTCSIQPGREGEITIPSFRVQTNTGALTVPALALTVEPALIGEGRVPLASVAKSGFELPPGPVWAGEVFPVSYTLEVDRDYFYNLNGPIAWAPAPLVAEEWSKPEMTQTSLSGDRRALIRYRTRAVARDGGSVRLPALQQSVILKIGSVARGAVIEPKTRPFVITTAPAALRVRPLPVPTPANFTGLVGQVKLTASVSPLKVAVGDPITWTVTLEGEANWPDVAALPARSVAKDLRALPSALRRSSRDGSLFNGGVSEDVVLIAAKPGAYALGPAAFSVFDPSQGKYETLTAHAVTIDVEPASAAALAAAAKNNVGEAADDAESAAGPSRAAPVVPRDLIRGSAGAGDAFASGCVLGLHDGWDIPDCLELAVCAAAASLRDPSCSAAILPWTECLEFGRGLGFSKFSNP